MVTISDIYLNLGKKRADDLAYDSSGTSTVSQVITCLIDSAYTWLSSKAISCGKPVDTAGVTDNSKIQNQAVLYYSIYLLFEYSQSSTTGEPYRVNAYNLLLTIFGESALDYGDSENKPKKCLIGITNSSGRKLDITSFSQPYNTYK